MDGSYSIDAQRALLDAQLRKYVGAGVPYALVDFPSHSNVGDSAIWLGEIALLRAITGRAPAYTCHHRCYDPDELRAALPEGPIFIHGGGNFGDLYPDHQQLRHAIIDMFRDRLVVQLPQSIHYRSEAGIAETADIVARHTDFHLLVRDHASLEIARRHFRCSTDLLPDAAFGMGALAPRGPIRHDAVFLLRTDIEKVSDARESDFAGRDVAVHDWMYEPDLELRARLKKKALLRSALSMNWSRMERRNVISDMLASFRVERGLATLSSGKVVLTDRLHGHILTLLLQKPHVVLDNSYGKIASYLEAWTGGSPLVRKAATLDEALREVDALAGVAGR